MEHCEGDIVIASEYFTVLGEDFESNRVSGCYVGLNMRARDAAV